MGWVLSLGVHSGDCQRYIVGCVGVGWHSFIKVTAPFFSFIRGQARKKICSMQDIQADASHPPLPLSLPPSLPTGAVFGGAHALALGQVAPFVERGELSPLVAETVAGGIGGGFQGLVLSPTLLLKVERGGGLEGWREGWKGLCYWALLSTFLPLNRNSTLPSLPPFRSDTCYD